MKPTFRDVLRWGDAQKETRLSPGQVAALAEMLGLELDPERPRRPGREPLTLEPPQPLPPGFLSRLEEIVGPENLAQDELSRAGHACGKFYGELVELRRGRVPHPPQAVVYPRNQAEVQALVELCSAQGVPLIPFGGHTSVTRGVAAPRGGICLDLTRHLKRVLEINQENQTVTAQTGIMGPALEAALNRAGPGYTLGHFPQSFEFSTLGGWLATRGAGQVSTGYGKIEDMVLGLRVVTPAGIITTPAHPAESTGPDLDRLFLGSEGTLGVITQATLKIQRHLPRNTRLAAYLFRDFPTAVQAVRHIMQARGGRPYLLRLLDPEETEVAFRLRQKSAPRLLAALGYSPGRRCLLLLSVEGQRRHARSVARGLGRLARRAGALPLGRGPVRHWLEQRYRSAYLREPLMDLGLRTDTLETAVSWDRLLELWSAARAYIKSRPHTLCLVHLSHAYSSGANLYFTFISPMAGENELEDYQGFLAGLVETILDRGGALSHHHGIGRLLAPWMPREVGQEGLDLLRAIKRHLDPRGVMNPGGTLGLDRE